MSFGNLYKYALCLFSIETVCAGVGLTDVEWVPKTAEFGCLDASGEFTYGEKIGDLLLEDFFVPVMLQHKFFYFNDAQRTRLRLPLIDSRFVIVDGGYLWVMPSGRVKYWDTSDFEALQKAVVLDDTSTEGVLRTDKVFQFGPMVYAYRKGRLVAVYKNGLPFLEIEKGVSEEVWRLSSEVNRAGAALRVKFDDLGRFSTLILGDREVVEFIYNEFGELYRIVRSSDGDLVMSYVEGVLSSVSGRVNKNFTWESGHDWSGRRFKLIADRNYNYDYIDGFLGRFVVMEEVVSGKRTTLKLPSSNSGPSL